LQLMCITSISFILRSVALSSCFFLYDPAVHRVLHSFPTRRSSDLTIYGPSGIEEFVRTALKVSRTKISYPIRFVELAKSGLICEDRKSTRLNSSHVSISYAVFCLKKKTHKRRRRYMSDNICAHIEL